MGVKTLGAKQRPLLGLRGRSRRAGDPDGDPDDVAVSRLTVIDAKPLEDERAAASWLGAIRTRAVADDEIEVALGFANRIIHAHRLAAHDPYENELSRAGAHRIRLGYGTGDQVAESTWTEARVIPTGADTGPRRPRLDPEPGVAEILAGRTPEFAADDLLLRARLDLDQGRPRQAALQAAAAARALAAEPDGADLTGQTGPLEKAAIERPLNEQQQSELEQVIASMQRTVRRRMHSG